MEWNQLGTRRITGCGDLLSTNNLSDLADAPTARTNLGLGTLALLGTVTNAEITDVSPSKLLQDGAASGEVLQWNGTTWVPVTLPGGGDLLSANNLSDLADAPTARTNLGLGALAILNSVSDAEITNLAPSKLLQEGAAAGEVLQWNGTTWVPVTLPGGGDLLSANNLSDLADAPTARTNLGLGALATLGTVTDAEITDVAPSKLLQDGAASGEVLQWNGTTWVPVTLPGGGDLLSANNLSDLADAPTARTNLGLGTLATLGTVSDAEITDVAPSKLLQDGAASGEVLQWNGTTWVPVTLPGGGDLLSANNLSDLADAPTARTNLGLGTLATLGAVTDAEITDVSPSKLLQDGAVVGEVLQWDGVNWVPVTLPGGGDLLSANNLSDLADAPTARTNLGLGTLATLGTITDTEITDVSPSKFLQDGAAVGEVLQWDGTNWVPVTLPGGGDMLATTYDPGSIAADVYDRTNHIGTQAISTIDPVGGGQRAILGSDDATNTWITGSPNQVFTTDGAGSLQFENKSNFVDVTAQTGILIGNGTSITGVTSTAGVIYRGDGATLVASNIFDDGTNIGIGTTTPTVSLEIVGNDAVQLPRGTTAQQPGTPNAGMIRFNTETPGFEGYNGATWNSLGGAGSLQTAYDGGNIIQLDGANEFTVLKSDASGFIGTNEAGNVVNFNSDINIQANGEYRSNGARILASGIFTTSVGTGAGFIGTDNVFVGTNSGAASDGTTFRNTFLGHNSGSALVTGNSNTFLGTWSAGNAGSGTFNTIVGSDAGFNLNSGTGNTYLGSNTGDTNLNGNNVILIGAGSDVGVDGLNNAIAIGTGAVVNNNNELVLGATGTSVAFDGELRPAGDPGTLGQILTSAGPGATPTWSAAGAAGSLQAAYDGGATITMTAAQSIAIETSTSYPILTLDETNEFVGIGTGAPTSPLEVFSSTSSVPVIASTTATGATNEAIRGQSTGATQNIGIGGNAVGGSFSVGISGVANDASGSNAGVYGTAFNSSNAASIIGVQGENQGATTATDSYALFGVSGSTGTTSNFGLYATASGGANNFAGFFDAGDVVIQQNLGIGTTSPAAPLNVIGVNSNPAIQIEDGNLVIRDVGDDDNAWIRAASGTDWQFGPDNLVFGGSFVIGRTGAMLSPPFQIDGTVDNIFMQDKLSIGGDDFIDLTTNDIPLEVSSSASNGTFIDILSVDNFGSNPNTGSFRLGYLANNGVDPTGFLIRDIANAANRFYITTGGNVGVGNTDPRARLDVGEGGLITSLGDESIALTRDGGEVFLETYSNDGSEGMLMLGGSLSGVVKKAAFSGTGVLAGLDEGLHIFHQGNFPTIFTTNNIERMRVETGGNISVNIGTATSQLHVVKSSTGVGFGAVRGSSTTGTGGFYGVLSYRAATTQSYGVYAHSDALANTSPLGVNRAADGALVSLISAGTVEGQISVSGNTVSYNAFTGSHYAKVEEAVDRATLVVMTDKNDYLNNNRESEVIYGVTPSTKANDPKVLGSYLGLVTPQDSYSVENPHQIMAVGNGVVWVADNGENIETGDFLISSHVEGHAMKDDGSFELSYIFAKAAEPVNWSEETRTINGVKHKKISVFFENFVINHKADKLEQELDELRNEFDQLKQLILQNSLTTSNAQND